MDGGGLNVMPEFLDLEIARQIPNFWPAVLLAVGFPAVLLVLNEAIAACDRRGLALARSLRAFRTLVAPALALLIFVTSILEMPMESTASRVTETIFWVVLLYAILGLFNDLFFGLAGTDSWRERVPTLFRDLVRAILVAIGGLVIYSKVWGQEVEGALAALGVGSIVIGLALQEPLGNLVSGLMLLFERPLSVGDWVQAEGVKGKVTEINWRSVRIETPTREQLIVPNVSLYKSAFSNLSRPTTVRSDFVEIGFSYDDPPNRVKQVMLELLRSTPGVLADPSPAVRTVAYADFSVTYRLLFSVARQEELGATRDEILTRLWYAARRADLTIPYPITLEYGPDESPGKPSRTIDQLLHEHARFKPAADDSRPPRIVEFAKGESVQAAGQRFRGFALVVEGRATLQTTDSAGRITTVGEIGPGECFGDQLAIGAAADDVGIVAADDLKVVVFDPAVIGGLLQRSPGLAAEIGDSVEARRQAVRSAKR
jgi:small-conductance mechanosensitive channel